MNGACPMLKQNESTFDRVIRIIVGIIALLVGYTVLSGAAQTIVYVVGLIALLTGAIGFCGLYALLGISTLKSKQS